MRLSEDVFPCRYTRADVIDGIPTFPAVTRERETERKEETRNKDVARDRQWEDTHSTHKPIQTHPLSLSVSLGLSLQFLA